MSGDGLTIQWSDWQLGQSVSIPRVSNDIGVLRTSVEIVHRVDDATPNLRTSIEARGPWGSSIRTRTEVEADGTPIEIDAGFGASLPLGPFRSAYIGYQYNFESGSAIYVSASGALADPSIPGGATGSIEASIPLSFVPPGGSTDGIGLPPSVRDDGRDDDIVNDARYGHVVISSADQWANGYHRTAQYLSLIHI